MIQWWQDKDRWRLMIGLTIALTPYMWLLLCEGN
jgi:hypothetical protein